MDEQWHWRTEQQLELSLPGPVEPITQRRLLAMAADMRGQPGVVEAVPGLHSLSLIADLRRIAPQQLEALARRAWLRAKPARERRAERRLAVRYGGSAGPDLADAAALLDLSEDQLIQAHAAPRYEVACLGFLPGFAYLLGLPPPLALPRRDQPRLRVPAGSVGIGGTQTGIYPLDSPGGWQLIGHCAQPLFDADAAQPSWLLPGDFLRFEPVRDHA
jgi:KipI family sensor histidine kinase inhibitor